MCLGFVPQKDKGLQIHALQNCPETSRCLPKGISEKMHVPIDYRAAVMLEDLEGKQNKEWLRALGLLSWRRGD